MEIHGNGADQARDAFTNRRGKLHQVRIRYPWATAREPSPGKGQNEDCGTAFYVTLVYLGATNVAARYRSLRQDSPECYSRTTYAGIGVCSSDAEDSVIRQGICQ